MADQKNRTQQQNQPGSQPASGDDTRHPSQGMGGGESVRNDRTGTDSFDRNPNREPASVADDRGVTGNRGFEEDLSDEQLDRSVGQGGENIDEADEEEPL